MMLKLSGCTSLGVILLAGHMITSCGPKYDMAWQNPKLPVEERVNDLVGRLTLDQKISQMCDVAPAIDTLGIPAYNWWNEGLHGVARAGIATVFPQAIGMAATFNDSLLHVEASVISDEFRAKYNEAVRNNDRSRYRGLTVWSPNINIFRDPRWGRGQETYGEDPFLTSRMGVAFAKGLQGEDSKYLKCIATPKHYAVHSGPELLRHVFDVYPSQRDFLDTYTPAFEACVKEAKAYSVMSAYNRVRGKSATGSDSLMNVILRQQWGFEGYVVSDCDAVSDIWATHKIVPTAAEASAIALKSGCDLDCGFTYLALKEAVEKNLITEADIDVALKRLFTARFKLGMFDPAEMVAYNSIPYTNNDSPENRALSVETAKQSLVLLKNVNNTLPLKKDLKTIAVIGPNADNAEVMYGNYNGTPSKFVTPLQGIRNKVGANTQVLYAQGSSWVDFRPELKVITGANMENDGQPGLKAEYFDNLSMEGTPYATVTDSAINFSWDSQGPAGHGTANFSARWTGKLVIPENGLYEIAFTGDDGFRLFIDGKKQFESWMDQSPIYKSAKMQLKKGSKHDIRIEYYQRGGGAAARLEWGMSGIDPFKKVMDIAAQADVIVYVGGLSPSLEGEEMQVPYEGFSGGDRTKIGIPELQTTFMKKLQATGKPVVFVMMTGSALAINWENENLPAILLAWYPGQEGGTAIADALFGDYNPAGRLPVTFYKSETQLPEFTDYSMKGKTYRYFEGEPLYPFGYGLSYTSFTYSGLSVPAEVKAGEDVKVSVVVENTGKMDGDEVVQLYVKHTDATVPVPLQALQGFKRVHLKAGEKKTVEFTLSPRSLSVISQQDERVVMPGTVTLFVGGGQPTDKSKTVVQGAVKVTGEIFAVK
ncbi:MAG: glycoside hydrolase family 3 C-terminal domain-containing protein [Bacteroidales bacterium]